MYMPLSFLTFVYFSMDSIHRPGAECITWLNYSKAPELSALNQVTINKFNSFSESIIGFIASWEGYHHQRRLLIRNELHLKSQSTFD